MDKFSVVVTPAPDKGYFLRLQFNGCDIDYYSAQITVLGEDIELDKRNLSTYVLHERNLKKVADKMLNKARNEVNQYFKGIIPIMTFEED